MARSRVRGFFRCLSQHGPLPSDSSCARQAFPVPQRFRKAQRICFLLAVAACMIPGGWAQVSDVDDVHVIPRVAPPDPTKSEILDPALQTHTKPMKVDV